MFIEGYQAPEDEIWTIQQGTLPVTWDNNNMVEAGTNVQLHFEEPNKPPMVFSSQFILLGRANMLLKNLPKGLFRALVAEDGTSLTFKYLGPKDLDWHI